MSRGILALLSMSSFCGGLLVLAFLVSGWAAIGVFLVGLGITANICWGLIDIEEKRDATKSID